MGQKDSVKNVEKCRFSNITCIFDVGYDLKYQNRKNAVSIGQDRKSAFTSVEYFVWSRAWLSKAQSEPLIYHFQVVKMVLLTNISIFTPSSQLYGIIRKTDEV